VTRTKDRKKKRSLPEMAPGEDIPNKITRGREEGSDREKGGALRRRNCTKGASIRKGVFIAGASRGRARGALGRKTKIRF